MVLGLKKTGDVLARSDLCHLHDGRAEAESCAIDPKLRRQDRGSFGAFLDDPGEIAGFGGRGAGRVFSHALGIWCMGFRLTNAG